MTFERLLEHPLLVLPATLFAGGLAIGIAFALPTSNEFLAAVGGAIAGGAIAAMLQLFALRAAERERKAAGLERRRALAQSLLVKTLRIHATLTAVHDQVEKGLARGRSHRPPMKPWQSVLAVANPPLPVHFAPEEMTMLLGAESFGAFNRFLNVDMGHNAVVQLVTVYSERREQLTDTLTPQELLEDGLGRRDMTHQENLAIAARGVELNSLIEAIKTASEQGIAETESARDLLLDFMREKLGLEYGLDPKHTPEPF